MKSLWLFIFLPSLTFAQNPIAQFGPEDFGADDIGELIGFQNKLVFPASLDGKGSEVWTLDATRHGEILKDINPGAASSAPAYFTTFDNKLFFVATDATHGAELWVTDGTPNGTVLLKDINPGTAGSNISSLHVLPGAIYFAADDGTHGLEIWKSNGTEAGTTLVKDIKAGVNGSAPHDFIAFKGHVFFAADDGMVDNELWKTDGTEAGTALVKDLLAGYLGSDPHNLAVVGDVLYFSGSYGNSLGGSDFICIYKSDGTAAGTTFVVRTPMYRPYYTPELWPQNFAQGGHYILFSYASNNISALTLWMLDVNTNTISSTGKRVGKDLILPYDGDLILAEGYDPTVGLIRFSDGGFSTILTQSNSSYSPVLKTFNDKVFLITQSYSSSYVTVFDGANGSTQELKTTGMGGTPMILLNGNVYFTGVVPGPNKAIFKYQDPTNGLTDTTAFDIYPNPVEKTLNIQFPESEFEVLIVDMQGRILKKFSQATTIDVSDISTGVYLLVCSGNERSITRFVKK